MSQGLGSQTSLIRLVINMKFKYIWKRNEANFGPPIEGEVSGGTHISAENILKFKGKYVALRRPKAIPEHEIPPKALKANKPHLYFVHGLPRWGETLDQYVKRMVKDQAGVNVKNFKVVNLTMEVYPDTNQWAWTPYLIVEIDKLPTPGTYGNEVTEVVTFAKEDIPEDFGWWKKQELEEFLGKI